MSEVGYGKMQGGVIPSLSVQIQDHLRIAAWVPAVGGGVDRGPFYTLRRRVCQQLPGVVLHSNWLVLG